MSDGDVEGVAHLLRLPDVPAAFGVLGDGAAAGRALVREGLSTWSVTACWLITTAGGEQFSLGTLCEPSTASLALRAIGWRSLEVMIAIAPHYRRRGLAAEALKGVAAEAGRDGVTFALIGCVDDANVAGHALMTRCRFEALGTGRSRGRPVTVYERTL